MAKVVPGRRMHHHDIRANGDDVVVFLIGMRINKLWRPDAWGPVLAAMTPMLTELSRDASSGLLGFRTLLGLRGPTVVQYWRSVEELYAYASARDAEHRPAWTAFNRRAKKVPGAVGIWHETYVGARAESMYVDMPVIGLAAATESAPVTSRLDRAQGRLAAVSESEV